MRRDQLEHAIRTACQIIGRPEVIVVGSQSILGTYREDQLPADATMSVEIDILPIADDNDETARLADLIEGVAGELSPFEELDGFYTFLMGTSTELALIRDPFACKPAVVAENDDYVAIASEFRSLAHLPDIKNARVFEPAPEEMYVWKA